MEISKRIIGEINGEDIYVIKFTNQNNYSLEFYNLGGYMHSILIPYKNDKSKREDVLLGYGDLAGCKASNGYFNSIIGRVCNRIGGANFKLNNFVYNLFKNIPPHHLHGGKQGFNKKIWKIDKLYKKNNLAECKMNYLSPHLEENYPGNLLCTSTYSLNNNNDILISFEATSDQDTIVNLTNHNYWNFHGHNHYYQNIVNHNVCIKSNYICQLDDYMIPTGKMLSVQKTKFDLNKSINISQKFLNLGGIDHNYKLNNSNLINSDGYIYSNLTGMGVEYFTNQPGMQFYSGNMMEKNYNGKENKIYGINYGICFEPQNFPDAINQTNFPSSILKKGEKYNSIIKMHLRNDFI